MVDLFSFHCKQDLQDFFVGLTLSNHLAPIPYLCILFYILQLLTSLENMYIWQEMKMHECLLLQSAKDTNLLGWKLGKDCCPEK